MEEIKTIAIDVYNQRTNNVATNRSNIQKIVDKYPSIFAPILEQNPHFANMLAHMLVLRFGFRVQEVSWITEMKDWTAEDNRRVGRAMAPILRMVQTKDAAVDAWRSHYPQLQAFIDEVPGFNEFMLIIVSGLLRDNKFIMLFRVSCGASLSILDALTDIYTIATYYRSDDLVLQANAMLAMISTNLFLQLVLVLATYGKKSWTDKLIEAAITVFFLRPIVDAYRVSTNQEDEETTFENMEEMIINKCSELATESIPGCVLQLYVWLNNNPEDVGTYALISIGISALTTGYNSAIIAFDFDTDEPRRKNQPEMYGYIPKNHGLRERCFRLMTLMSALHNLSRSLGCALLIVSGGKTLAGERARERAKRKRICERITNTISFFSIALRSLKLFCCWRALSILRL